MTDSISSTSPALRAMMPDAAIVSHSGLRGTLGTRPAPGRKPTTFAEARRRAHRATEIGAKRERCHAGRQGDGGAAARAARCTIQGVGVGGIAPRSDCRTTRQSRTPACWSCRSGCRPPFLRRATMTSSSTGTLSLRPSEPYVVRTPAVAIKSLTANGTPCSGPTKVPCIASASSRAASASACSDDTVMKA